MGLSKRLQDCIAGLLALTGGWLACVALCASATVQRHVFYAHKAPIWWSQKLRIPESFGFLHNQVLPLTIVTGDGEKLYAWLITPLALYARHEEAFLGQMHRKQDESDIAVKLLRDSDSQLVIYFHGMAGTVGQTRRTDAYRTITSGISERTHVLTFDYRGFGYSSGVPTERGLINDAKAVVKWSTTVGKVPTRRIVLLAQSLGTAVASAVVEELLEEDPETRFAGICLCAAFTDAPSVFMSYRIAGYIAILSPLEWVPSLRNRFFRAVRDKWPTQQRLVRVVQRSRGLRLVLLAATCDEVIPWSNTEDLFYTAIAGTIGTQDNPDRIDEISEITESKEGGTVQVWKSETKSVRKIIVRYGGHNGIMKWAPVALEVLKCFSDV